MNKPAAILCWALATVAITLIVAWLIHPAVILGTMIGVALTTAKNMHLGE